MADHALGRLHCGHFIFRRHGSGVGNAGGQFQHIDPEEVLIVHPGAEPVAIRLGRGIAGQLDMIDVGLLDASWCDRFPPALATRLQELFDNPNG